MITNLNIVGSSEARLPWLCLSFLRSHYHITMKRDMEMIRQILIDVEAHDSSKPCLQVSDANAAYQIALMEEAGLVEAVILKDQQGLPHAAALLRLTWAGHDFLDSSRDSKIWKMAVEHIIKPGASWSFSILAEWLKQEAHRQIFGATTNAG